MAKIKGTKTGRDVSASGESFGGELVRVWKEKGAALADLGSHVLRLRDAYADARADGEIDGAERAELARIVHDIVQAFPDDRVSRSAGTFQKKYQGIVAQIREIPILQHFLEGQFPGFLTLFDEKKSPEEHVSSPISPELLQEAEGFLREATARAQALAVSVRKHRARIEQSFEASVELRQEILERLGVLEEDALRLAGYGEQGVRLHVSSFLHFYNGLAPLVGQVLHYEHFSPISLAFLHQEEKPFSPEVNEGVPDRARASAKKKPVVLPDAQASLAQEQALAERIDREVGMLVQRGEDFRAFLLAARDRVRDLEANESPFREHPLVLDLVRMVKDFAAIDARFAHEVGSEARSLLARHASLQASQRSELFASIAPLQQIEHQIVLDFERLRTDFEHAFDAFRAFLAEEISVRAQQLPESRRGRFVKHLADDVLKKRDKKLLKTYSTLEGILHDSAHKLSSSDEESLSAFLRVPIDKLDLSESIQIRIARILADAQSQGIVSPLIDRARARFPLTLGGKSPEEALALYAESLEEEKKKASSAQVPETPDHLVSSVETPPLKKSLPDVGEFAWEDAFEQKRHRIDTLLASVVSDAAGRNIHRKLLLEDPTYVRGFSDAKMRNALEEVLRVLDGLPQDEIVRLLASEIVPVKRRLEGFETRRGRAPEVSPDARRRIPPSPVEVRIEHDEEGEEEVVPPIPDIVPASRRELGPVPLPEQQREVSSIDASPGLFDRARAWVKHQMHAVDQSLGKYDVYRAHIRGEVTRREQYGVSPTLSRGAMVAGAALSGALSYFGAALPFDAVRYATQRYFTGVERDEIRDAFRVALAERKAREAEKFEGEDVRERASALQRRIESSRYLTDVQKAELLRKLEDQYDMFAAQEEPHAERLHREVGRILEHAIRTRVTGEKVVKEATNTLFLVSGMQFLRAPAYGAISVYSRWHRLTRENPESSAGDRLRATISGGFEAWWDEAKGGRGRLAQAAAFGTAARFVGMGATFVETVTHSEALTSMLNAWENHEHAYPADAHHLSERPISSLEERVYERVERGAPSAPVHAAPEVHDTYATSDVSHADTGSFADSDVHDVAPHASDDFAADDVHDVVMSPDRIPDEALVRHGDGVTQSLLAAVEARPEMLSAADRVALHDDYAAALFMRRLAARDGLLDSWLSEKAIGHVAIVPTYVDGEAHIAFLNPETGSAYSIEEMRDLGYLVKAAKKAA